jgi:2,5-dichlorohydroquinone reductive dechlorinase
VDVSAGQTYLPAYVRLRMVGCERFGGALVAHHSGSTSASAGCDGAVVPTLIDWQTGDVLVDSKRICIRIDAHEARRLRPAALAGPIDEELAVVDNFPNYQLLLNRAAGRPDVAADGANLGANFPKKKVAWCDRYLREVADDPVLVKAYTAKRAKELSAANGLFTPEALRAAYDTAERALQDLERKLARGGAMWLFGDTLTMADLFWAIELLRMKNVGVADRWEAGRLPRVERLVRAAEAMPALRSAILDWPGALY